MANPQTQTEKLRERIIGLFMQFGTDVKRAKHPSPIEYSGEILKACKEGIEIEGITYRLKFVPDKWWTPVGVTLVGEVLKWVDNINSQIKDIEL